MTTRRDFIKVNGITAAGLSLGLRPKWFNDPAGPYESHRPKLSERKFTSAAVEEKIKSTKASIKDPELAWMFENCYPNTLDTTVNYSEVNGMPDTFVITGDINAMWLRDSSAQVWPYLPLITKTAARSNDRKGCICSRTNRRVRRISRGT